MALKESVYKILDALTMKRGSSRHINGFDIRLPLRYARYYEDNYESETFKFFEKNIKPDQTILDIGAHIGLYTVFFSKKLSGKGMVHGFEPTPGTFAILQQTVQLNQLDNCRLVNVAIAEKSGTMQFNLTTNNGEGSNANSLVRSQRSVNAVDVRVYSIDDYRKAEKLKIDVLKIDVEGYELNALKGARETFLIDRPFGILALHPESIKQLGQTLEQIWDLLMDYKCEVEFHGKPINREEFCTRELLFDVEFKCK